VFCVSRCVVSCHEYLLMMPSRVLGLMRFQRHSPDAVAVVFSVSGRWMIGLVGLICQLSAHSVVSCSHAAGGEAGTVPMVPR